MRRWMLIACLGALALGVVTEAAADPPANEFQLGAGYAAKEGCSCVFVQGQTDAICTSYATTPTGLTVKLTIDHTANTVTAAVAGSTRVAAFTSRAGCVLQGL